MSIEQSEALSKAFSVTHIFDIFLQLAPYIMLATSIIFVVLLIRVAITKITDYLSFRRYGGYDGNPLDFASHFRNNDDEDSLTLDNDDYLEILEDDIEFCSTRLDDPEKRWIAQTSNREYKRITGHYYVDPKKLRN